jgi:hypothetical protein
MTPILMEQLVRIPAAPADWPCSSALQGLDHLLILHLRKVFIELTD